MATRKSPDRAGAYKSPAPPYAGAYNCMGALAVQDNKHGPHKV